MTVQEVSDRLDAAINRNARGIIVNEYFKSFYLTQAQTLFVDNVLSTYEYGDAMRHVLGKVIKEVTLGAGDVMGTEDGVKILPYSIDVKSVVYEKTNDVIECIPMDYNDIYANINSPFRKPNKKISYRVTMDNKIRLFTSETFLKYDYIYCKIPTPIVLEDLPVGLQIQGLGVATESELPYDSVIKVIELASNLIFKDKARFVQDRQPVKK